MIALARVAMDYPEEVARYKDTLLALVGEKDRPHVLMRHFAARTLLSCMESGKLIVPTALEQAVRTADISPHARLKQKIRIGGGFYQGRPAGSPKPAFEFHLDYDFHKYDVDNLSRVFGKPCSEVEDSISRIVHDIDPSVTSMYDLGGRESRSRRNGYGMTNAHHTLGQHFGWHALFFTAGEFLRDSPVTEDSWSDADPWDEWLRRYQLTRRDGFWLSDGTDRAPLDTFVVLLEKAKEGLALTGDPAKLSALLKLTDRVGSEVVVQGDWSSADSIRIHVSSAFVEPSKALPLVNKLLREPPIIVGLPTLSEGEDEEGAGPRFGRTGNSIPWIVRPSREAKLDEYDPYGTSAACQRLYLARAYESALKLVAGDPFGRSWNGKRGAVALRAEAWGRDSKNSDSESRSGSRLICSASSLRETLSKQKKHLVIAISIQRYEESYRRDSKYTHSVAVVRISDTLDVEYFPGRVNHLHKSNY